MIKKKYLTTKGDIVNHYRAALIKRNVIPIIFILILLITVAAVKVMDMNGGSKIFMFILIPIVAIFTIIHTPYSLAKKILKQNVFFQHDISIEISSEGLRQEAYNSNMFLKWSEAHNYFESKKNFAILISEQQACIIPKRIFTFDEITTISKILKGNITPPKNSQNKKILIGIAIYIMLFLVILLALIFLQP